jgi:glycosyltransferase involved in cell wall biosynthesis
MNKVTHVITTIMRGGAENQLLEVARQQVLTGWEVKVVFLKGEPELFDSLKNAGATVDSSLNNRNIVIQFFKLRKLLSISTTKVHAHLPRAELICALATSKNKLIITRHNSEPFFPSAPRILSVILSRFVCIRAKSGIAITNAVKDYLISSREIHPSFEINVVHYGYSPKIEAPNSKSGKLNPNITPTSSLKLITVGRLVPQKDQKTLIKSVAMLLQSKYAVELTIVGEGTLRRELESLVMNLKVENYVTLPGRITNPIDELPKYDVFVLPSIYEGFGLVLLEAMDCGLPIVAADNTCIPEVLGHAGVLFKTGSAADLTEKIMAMFDSVERNRQSDLSQSRLREFSPESMCASLIEIYEKS